MRIVRNLVGIWEKKVRNLFRHSTEHRVHTHLHTLYFLLDHKLKS